MVKLVLVRCHQKKGSTSTKRFIIPEGLNEATALARGLRRARGRAYYPEESSAWVVELDTTPTWAEGAEVLS